MPQVTTSSFKVATAKSLMTDIAAPSSAYYVTIGRPQGWPANVVPTPDDSFSGRSFGVFDTMVSGKRVANTDVNLMVKRYDWQANTVYTMYDDQDANIINEPYYVSVTSGNNHCIFKCLDNRGGIPSTVAPDPTQTSANDPFYQTSDGYRWRYMSTVNATTWSKFSTNSWMPIVTDSNVVGNAIAGAIDVIVVQNGGSGITNYTTGTFKALTTDASGTFNVCTLDSSASANTNFYTGCAIKVVAGAGAGQQRTITSYTTTGGNRVAIIDVPWDANNLPNSSSTYEVTPNVLVVGDGSGTVARAIVNTTANTISGVEITKRGFGYTFATASVGSNTAILRPVISPKYGHGGDLALELGATAVGVGVTINGTESGSIDSTGSFSQTTLMKDPIWSSVSLSLTSLTGFFTTGETVSVANTAYSGVVSSFNSNTSVLVLSNVNGGFANSAAIVGGTSGATATIATTTIGGVVKDFTTFDQRLRLNVTYNGPNVFLPGDTVVQGAANAVVQYADTSFVGLVSVRGTFTANAQISTSTASANVVSVTNPDLNKLNGRVLYVEDTQSVPRSINTFRFVVSF